MMCEISPLKQIWAPALRGGLTLFLVSCLNKPLGSTVIAVEVHNLSDAQVALMQSQSFLAHPSGTSCSEVWESQKWKEQIALYPNQQLLEITSQQKTVKYLMLVYTVLFTFCC